MREKQRLLLEMQAKKQEPKPKPVPTQQQNSEGNEEFKHSLAALIGRGKPGNA